jgi:hypothetical protein
MFAVISAYPILDAVLMVPAVVILVNFRKEPLWFTPWICESAGIFLIALSDSWFVPIILTSFVSQLWLSSLFFAAHYLVIAAGLLWYIKFLVEHEYEGEDHDTDIAGARDDSHRIQLKAFESSPKHVSTNSNGTLDSNADNLNRNYPQRKIKPLEM